MSKEYLFTSESVSEGHPDKVADQISDGILDEHLKQDPSSHVACETLIAKDLLVIAGEFSTNGRVDFEGTAKKVLDDIGYGDGYSGFNTGDFEFKTSLTKQSNDIKQGVSQGDNKIGAGDQGLMFGYAVNETKELMPLPISLAHKLLLKHAELRKEGKVDWIMPDAKSQVTVKYADKKPASVEKIVLSTQHLESIEHKDIEEFVIEEIIKPVIPKELFSPSIEYFINPTGKFVNGGPRADSGLTGRKIIVDTYGGSAPHGGGAFSGKDATKVDRSAAYMARYIAKNIVAAELADKCTIQLAYSIGIEEPVSVNINLHKTGKVDETQLAQKVRKIFDLTPKGIIETLDLRRPIYLPTASYGHFGRSEDTFTWEKLDRVDQLKSL